MLLKDKENFLKVQPALQHPFRQEDLEKLELLESEDKEELVKASEEYLNAGLQ